jgi:murein DD-endopeptidase MepM/ murein hydrolase activator NlpD
VLAAVLAAALGLGLAPGPGPGPGPASGHAPGPASGPVRSLAPVVPWSWPVGPPHRVVRGFVAPEHPWSPGHRGIDVGAPIGSPVTAPDDGVVHFAGVVVDRPVLSMRHADGVLSSLEPVESDLSAGDPVVRGQVVGTVRPGHCADDECVHLGARVDGEYVSPLLMLGLGRPSVLLPTRRPR